MLVFVVPLMKVTTQELRPVFQLTLGTTLAKYFILVTMLVHSLVIALEHILLRVTTHVLVTMRATTLGTILALGLMQVTL